MKTFEAEAGSIWFAYGSLSGGLEGFTEPESRESFEMGTPFCHGMPRNATECRVLVEPEVKDEPDPMAALGFGPRTFKRPGRTTRDWMRVLREGDE